MFAFFLSFILTVAVVLTGLAWAASAESTPLLVGAAILALGSSLPFFYLFTWILSPLMDWETRLLERFDSPPVKAAKAAFRGDHPDGEIAWTRQIDEPARTVVIVFHGDTRPPHATGYSVMKGCTEAVLLAEEEAYLPEGRR